MEEIAAGRVRSTAAERRRRREIDGGALAIVLVVLGKWENQTIQVKPVNSLGMFIYEERDNVY